jgi:pterin-4a-carbinolamine dehydratase
MHAFHADDRTRDWRVVGDGATAVFRAGSFAAGARLVQAIAAAVGDAGSHHADVDLQHDTVTVRLLTATPGYTGMTTGDVEVAVRISDLAREQGLAADPTLIQTVQVTIDALVSADVMPSGRPCSGTSDAPTARTRTSSTHAGAARRSGSRTWTRPARSATASTSTSGCRRNWSRRASPWPWRRADGP